MLLTNVIERSTERLRFKGCFKEGIITRVFKLYLNFWSVFIIFIPIGMLLGRYQFNIKVFFSTFFALRSSYNAEWWFLRLYFMLVLLYPIIIRLLYKYSIKKVVLLSFMLNIFGLTTTKLSYVFGVSSLLIDCFNILLGGQFLFILGVVVSKSAIFNLIRDKVDWSLRLYSIILIFYTPIMAILIDLPVIGEILKLILIPVFIFLITNAISSCTFMEWIGKHSTNIWLTHSFFCYYLFPKIVFYPEYSILVFIWIMSLSLGSSYIVNIIINFMKKLSPGFKLIKLSMLK